MQKYGVKCIQIYFTFIIKKNHNNNSDKVEKKEWSQNVDKRS